MYQGRNQFLSATIGGPPDASMWLNLRASASLAKKLIDDDIEQAWIDEVKRRKAEIKSGKVTPISGHEVHKAARELLKK